MSRTHAPLFTVDGRGRVMRWSRGAERLTGRRAGDAVGRPVPEVFARRPVADHWLVGRVPDASGGSEWGVWPAGIEDAAGLDEAVLEAVFNQSAIGLHVVDRDLHVVRVNHVAVGMRGIPEEDLIGRPVAEAYASVRGHDVEGTLREVLETGRPVRDVLVRGHPPTDPLREHVFSATALRLLDRAGRPLGVVATAVDVTERERARMRLRLLHDAHERIGSSLDVERTARELVEVTVPDFADAVLVAVTDAVLRGKAPDLLPEEGTPLLRCAATGGAQVGPPMPATGSVLLAGLFGEGLPSEPTLLPAEPGADDEPATDAESATADEQGRDASAGTRLVAPLTVRGQIFGAVSFQRQATSEPFAGDDLALADAIAARTATCLENALRFTREHIVMTALQSWPLRQEQTTKQAVEVAQRHRPGGSGAGSWFDVIPLPGARVALVVGQVEDPGISAVATMSRLRTAVHSLTTLDLDPHELLARLHTTTVRLAREQSGVPGLDEPTASCTFVVHDPVSGSVNVARAGTSLFALVRPDGSVDTHPVAEGPLLGGADGPPFATAEHVVPAGSTVCLGSAPPEGEEGPSTQRLVTALARPDRAPEQMADDVEQLMAPESVLLVARTRHLPAKDLAEWDIPPEPSAVSTARRHVDRRVEDWAVPVDEFAVSLVVSELVTNAIRYGSAPITLRVIKGERTLICEVNDQALTAPHLRHARAVDEGGRGLHICSTLAESWGVRYLGESKTVWAEIALGGRR